MTERACRQCLATLSNELRDALSAMNNSLFVLLRCQPGDIQAKRAIQVIGRQISRLEAFIDGLMDAEQLQQSEGHSAQDSGKTEP
jgi:hypothetical protein